MKYLDLTGLQRLWTKITTLVKSYIKDVKFSNNVLSFTKGNGNITDVVIPPEYTLPEAGTSLGGVKSGGDVTISNGLITVNDNSHDHTIANVDGLQSALDGKQASGSYITTNNTGVQSITGGLVIGGTSATATGKGRIMVTGNTNPLIGLQAIDARGNQLTPYYFQVSNDVMYLGPTSSRALAFDSNGNTTIPASLTVTGTITEGGMALSSKYASKLVATASANGLMSATDKSKLDGLPTFSFDADTGTLTIKTT